MSLLRARATSSKTCTVRRDTYLEATLVAKHVVMEPLLNERTRRLWAAAQSIAIGLGGDAFVSSAAGATSGPRASAELSTTTAANASRSRGNDRQSEPAVVV
jgi:hypothetical protein